LFPVRLLAGRRSEELVRRATGEVTATRTRVVLPPCNSPLHEHLQRFVLAPLHRLVCAIARRSLAFSQGHHDHGLGGSSLSGAGL
jgi:hypothetical protein